MKIHRPLPTESASFALPSAPRIVIHPPSRPTPEHSLGAEHAGTFSIPSSPAPEHVAEATHEALYALEDADQNLLLRGTPNSSELPLPSALSCRFGPDTQQDLTNLTPALRTALRSAVGTFNTMRNRETPSTPEQLTEAFQSISHKLEKAGGASLESLTVGSPEEGTRYTVQSLQRRFAHIISVPTIKGGRRYFYLPPLRSQEGSLAFMDPRYFTSLPAEELKNYGGMQRLRLVELPELTPLNRVPDGQPYDFSTLRRGVLQPNGPYQSNPSLPPPKTRKA